MLLTEAPGFEKSNTGQEGVFLLERLMKVGKFRERVKRVRLLFLLGCVLLPVSCGSSYRGYKNAPYTVRGVRYHPMSVEQALTHREEGIASWYDESSWVGIIGGGKTAIGETVYPWTECAAHKTLPLPALVKVTNLENGRTAKVRVNDRGPFIRNRMLDVSSSVADDLDIKGKGTARVRMEVLSVGDGEWRKKAKR